jgi:hypothetical protein
MNTYIKGLSRMKFSPDFGYVLSENSSQEGNEFLKTSSVVY